MSSDSTAADVTWLIRSAIGIMTMQGGFALLEAGSVRKTNVVNIMMKNIADMGLGALIFWMIGYGLFAGKGNSFMGLNKFFLSGTNDYAHFIFNYSFAATASTIDSGAVAERMNFIAYNLLSIFTTGIVYPIVAHWIWTDEGWLSKLDFHDFAGSGCIHFLGGVSSITSAYLLGKRRILKQLSIQRATAIFGEMSNPVYQLYGTFILVIGWLSFNCGSVGQLHTRKEAITVGFVAVNTLIGGSSGMLFGGIISYILFEQIRVEYVTNPFLGALVAITANCDIIHHHEAFIIGLLAVPTIFLIEKVLDYFEIDDPVSVIPVHGGCGALSIITTGLFHKKEGLFYTGNFKLLGVQLLGLLVIGCWTLILTFIFLKLIDKYLVKLRVSVYEEDNGLDFTEHGVNSSEIARLKFMSTIVQYCEKLLNDNSNKENENPIKRILISANIKKGAFKKSWKHFKEYYGSHNIAQTVGRQDSITDEKYINRKTDIVTRNSTIIRQRRIKDKTHAAITDLTKGPLFGTGLRRLSTNNSFNTTTPAINVTSASQSENIILPGPNNNTNESSVKTEDIIKKLKYPIHKHLKIENEI